MTQNLKPIAGFKSLETHHCITGSLRHVYVFNQHPLNEELLLGIGGGVGFIYWHQKGGLPFIGGRGKGNVSEKFELDVGARTGVQISEFTTASAKKARSTMIGMLEAGQPVMIYVDMGFLPYLNFGDQDYHFGGHLVTACGWDEASQTVLIADRDKPLHSVPLADLENARGSKFQPFPPKNRWFTADFSQKSYPSREDFALAIREQVESALRPPISNFGVSGIRKAAKLSLRWPQVLDDEGLRFTMFNTYIFIDAKGGSGGGSFRYMFSRFLEEAAESVEIPALHDVAGDFIEIGDHWQDAGELFRENWRAPKPELVLPETSKIMNEIAEMEEAAWSALDELGKNIA